MIALGLIQLVFVENAVFYLPSVDRNRQDSNLGLRRGIRKSNMIVNEFQLQDSLAGASGCELN